MRLFLLLLVLTYSTTAYSASLNLEVWNPGQTNNEYKLAARITNYGNEPIALNRLKIKYWFFYSGNDSIVATSYSGNQTVYDAAGGWVATVDAASVAIQSISELDCGNGRKTNRVAEISFTDPANRQIPPNGGYVETNSTTNTLAVWRRSGWGGFDRTLDYSRVIDAGSSSATRSNIQHIALFIDGDRVCEMTSFSEIDHSSGWEPCVGTVCGGAPISPTPIWTPTNSPSLTPTPTFTPTPTWTSVVTATTTATVGSVVMKPEGRRLSVSTSSVAPTVSSSTSGKITVKNNGSTSIPLSELALSYWVSQVGTSPLAVVVDWAGILPAGQNVTSQILAKAKKIVDSSYWELVYSMTDSSANLLPGASLEIHWRSNRQDWGTMDQSDDFSYLESETFRANGLVQARLGRVVEWGLSPMLRAWPLESAAEIARQRLSFRAFRVAGAGTRIGFVIENNGCHAVEINRLSFSTWLARREGGIVASILPSGIVLQNDEGEEVPQPEISLYGRHVSLPRELDCGGNGEAFEEINIGFNSPSSALLAPGARLYMEGGDAAFEWHRLGTGGDFGNDYSDHQALAVGLENSMVAPGFVLMVDGHLLQNTEVVDDGNESQMIFLETGSAKPCHISRRLMVSDFTTEAWQVGQSVSYEVSRQQGSLPLAVDRLNISVTAKAGSLFTIMIWRENAAFVQPLLVKTFKSEQILDPRQWIRILGESQFFAFTDKTVAISTLMGSRSAFIPATHVGQEELFQSYFDTSQKMGEPWEGGSVGLSANQSSYLVSPPCSGVGSLATRALFDPAVPITGVKRLDQEGLLQTLDLGGVAGSLDYSASFEVVE